MRVKALQLLERLFRRIEKAAGSMGDRCAICPDCGRNRNTGKPCK
jgi:hypothetical protein